VKKRIVLSVTLAFLVALSSAYAQATDFFALVRTGTPQAVQDAIKQGADLNARDADGLTPLMRAAVNNPNPAVITVLLKAGADIKARDEQFGLTPLLWAASGTDNPEVVTTLLKAGADIKARATVNGFTALMYAADGNPNPAVITVLLKAGSDIDAKSNAKTFGMTPLMLAAQENQHPDKVIITLLKAGANAKATSTEGKTAFDYAKDNEYLEEGSDAYSALEEASQ